MTPQARRRQCATGPATPKAGALAIAAGLAGWLSLATVGCQAAKATHVQVDTDAACATCHRDDFGEARQPLHTGAISSECSQCHTEETWAPARGSDHPFERRGRHAETGCNSCHGLELPVYEGTPDVCIGCHSEDRARAKEPSHSTFSMDCGECHGDSAWQPANIDHEWPLEGAHRVTSCGSCHLGEPPVYEGTPTECMGCHSADRLRAQEPSHDEFSMACEDCHSATAWRPAAFPDHEWPLEGAHARAVCPSCHGVPPVYTDTPSECVDCHDSDRLLATNPPHDGFPNDCSQCHGTDSWNSADFEHIASFPLSGGHAQAECGSCHTGSPAVFVGLDAACVSCHESDAATSTFPGHDSFPNTCNECHSIDAWAPATGGEHPTDRFPLTGNHAFACNECHNPELGSMGSGNADCVGCHTGAHTLESMDARHLFIFGYPRDANRAPNFCLSCHQDGR